MKVEQEEKLLPDTIPELEIEIIRIEAEESLCAEELAKFLAAEDPAGGVFFAQEIHNLRHDKLRLHVEKEFCRKKIARIRLGIEGV